MKKKTLLIPDILIHRSPLAVHRLPMQGLYGTERSVNGRQLPFRTWG